MKLNLLFYVTSFLYFTLMHVGLSGKVDWGEDTKFRLLLWLIGKLARDSKLKHSPVCWYLWKWCSPRHASGWHKLRKASHHMWTGNGRLCPVLGENFQLRDIKSWSSQQIVKPHKWFTVFEKLSPACTSCESNLILQYCIVYITLVYITVLDWILNLYTFPPASSSLNIDL